VGTAALAFVTRQNEPSGFTPGHAKDHAAIASRRSLYTTTTEQRKLQCAKEIAFITINWLYNDRDDYGYAFGMID